jgi:hypothetical protein
MGNDVTLYPLSAAILAACRTHNILLVEGVIIIVLSSIFVLSYLLPNQSAFATFAGGMEK